MKAKGSALVLATVLAACAGASGDAPPTAPDAPADPMGEPASETSGEEPVAEGDAPPEAPADEPEAPAAEPEEPEEEEPPPGSLQARLMREHFKETELIRKALITGDIRKAVKPANALAQIKDIETLPGNWRLATKQLSEAARRIRQSSDLQETAAATADIGRACGSCHVAVRGPKAKLDDPPAAGSTMKDRMKRHKWGTERLWEALYVPSEKAWQAGMDVLEPLPKSDLQKGGVHALSAASRFAKLLEKGKKATTSDKRAEVYSSLLTTCSPCHEAMGK